MLARLTSIVFNMFAKEPLGYEDFCISDFGFEKKSQSEAKAKNLEDKFKKFMKH